MVEIASIGRTPLWNKVLACNGPWARLKVEIPANLAYVVARYMGLNEGPKDTPPQYRSEAMGERIECKLTVILVCRIQVGASDIANGGPRSFVLSHVGVSGGFLLRRALF